MEFIYGLKSVIIVKSNFMAKTLDELLKQETFSGKDVGTLYLYSLKKDIEDSYSGRLPEVAFPQEFFDKAYKSLIGRPEEFEVWRTYNHLEGKYFQKQKDFQTYRQQFYHFYTELELLFEEMERMDGVCKKLKELNIPEEKYEDIVSDLFYTSSLFEERNRTKLSSASNAIFHLKETMIYFYCSNKAYKDLFERLDVAFMNDTLFNMEELEKMILHLNELFFRVMNNQDTLTAQKLCMFFEPIDDFGTFYPLENTKFGIGIEDLGFQRDVDISIVDKIEATIDFSVQQIKEINGLY